MSVVSVEYKFQSFKVKVAANDSLNGALQASIAHFRLQKREGSRFVLFHNKTPVALDLPWRFLNLPAGAKLELLELGGVEGPGEPPKAPAQSIKVRFIVNNHYGTMMMEVDVQESVMDVLKKVAAAQEWDEKYLQSSKIGLQIISKRYDIGELEGHTFQSLGILESVSIRVTLPEMEDTTAVPRDIAPSALPEANAPAPTITKEGIPPAPQHEPVAYIPSEVPISTQITSIESEDDFEMTVEQARRYQNILSAKTGGLGGPLMTKRMREEMEEKRRHNVVVRECLVRVKFPDRTYLEIRFAPTDTSDVVYSQVRGSLVNDNATFKLYAPHPHAYVEPSSERELVRDLAFSTKTVLLYEQDPASTTGPFLKQSLLDHASVLGEPTEAPSHVAQTPASPSAVPEPKKKTLKKVPKWLKLSKK